jgi:cytochrome b
MTSADKRHGEATGESLGDLVAVHVWDWPVRVFHWAIVLLVIVAIATATIGGDAMVWHMRAGYGVLAMVLFRIVWGFAGTRHARFSSFVRGPRTAIQYARSFVRRAPHVVVGHNPLGGWSVIALLLTLLLQALTGLFANDDVIYEGPLAKHISSALSGEITAVHHLNVWAIGILIGMHVSAVVAHLAFAKENLVRPMVTGRKRLHRSLAAEAVEKVPHGRAIALLAGSVLSVWWLVTRL